ncbi:MAG: tetratricopeptide repeat protein [Lachnospiraceae bacterium]|nr:tetratricopeptide repeat protein [Lachnospiraceae bacterium]
MKTVTFYSYKGGVGRTLALAYTARYLAENNFSVCILDMDLEAPGIIYKLDENPDFDKLGVLDYIHACIDDDSEPPQSISEYFHTYRITPNGGYIKLMSAGRELDLAYWMKLASIDWNDVFFGNDKKGLFILNRLKKQIETQINPDYLFIDSRSGITILSRACCMALADTTVLLSANNEENRYGIGLMYHQITSSNFNIGNKKTNAFCALTRIPMPESGDSLTKESESVDKLIKTVGDPKLKHVDIAVIHSDRRIEFDEQIVLKDRSKDDNYSNINGDYFRLITKIVPSEVIEAKRKAIFNKPKHNFIEYDISSYVEKVLNCLRKEQSFEEFRADVERKVENEPISCENLYALAVCKRYEKKYTDGIADLSWAINICKNDEEIKIEIHYLLGIMFLYDFSNYIDATENLRVVCEIDENFENLQYHLSVSLLCLDSFDEAIEHINAHLRSNITDFKAYLLRAIVVLDKLEKYHLLKISESEAEINKALADFDMAIKYDSQNKYIYNSRGILYECIGDNEKAFSDYNKAIEFDPCFKLAYFNRANLYENIKNTEKALSDYNKAIELDPCFDKAYINRGLLFFKLVDMKKALSDYNKAIELDPNIAIAYNNRGVLFSDIENTEKALADYNKAIELNPNFAGAYKNRSILHKRLGNEAEANKDMNKYNELTTPPN